MAATCACARGRQPVLDMGPPSTGGAAGSLSVLALVACRFEGLMSMVPPTGAPHGASAATRWHGRPSAPCAEAVTRCDQARGALAGRWSHAMSAPGEDATRLSRPITPVCRPRRHGLAQRGHGADSADIPDGTSSATSSNTTYRWAQGHGDQRHKAISGGEACARLAAVHDHRFRPSPRGGRARVR